METFQYEGYLKGRIKEKEQESIVEASNREDSIKPKNRVYYIDCGRKKMLFQSEEKALRFIRYNSTNIYQQAKHTPVRAYYCSTCCGYHITSSKNWEKCDNYCRTDSLIELNETKQTKRKDEVSHKNSYLNLSVRADRYYENGMYWSAINTYIQALTAIDEELEPDFRSPIIDKIRDNYINCCIDYVNQEAPKLSNFDGLNKEQLSTLGNMCGLRKRFSHQCKLLGREEEIDKFENILAPFHEQKEKIKESYKKEMGLPNKIKKLTYQLSRIEVAIKFEHFFDARHIIDECTHLLEEIYAEDPQNEILLPTIDVLMELRLQLKKT